MAIQDINGFFVGLLEGGAETCAALAPQSGLYDQDSESVDGSHVPARLVPEYFNHAEYPCLSIGVAKSLALLSQHPYGRGVSKKPPHQERLEEPALSSAGYPLITHSAG
jgi:hypothetical protein